jgi:hypothetical protein
LTRAGAAVVALIAITLAVPLGIRVLNAGQAPPAAPSYLPALEGPRERRAFDSTPVVALGHLKPPYVVIGDSMAGTRIDGPRLSQLAGGRVMPLLQAGSGSAWWYLVLKNWVIASGARPRVVFIFFRDTNLTNVMFRLDDRYRWMLDLAAAEREPELNDVIAAATAGPWHRAQAAVVRFYGAERARTWVEPAVTNWIGRVIEPSRRRRTAFMTDMNARFGLDHLAPLDAADLQAAEDREANFDRDVNRSVLPLMLRDARAAGLTICFVRVQRRPLANRPPRQSPALRAYVEDLRRYVEAGGALWRDDTGDPAMTLDMYEDGDHLDRSARVRYTEIFFERLRPVFGER